MAQGFLNRLVGKIPGQGLTLQERLLGQQAPSTDDIDIPNLNGVDTSSQYFKENYGDELPAVNITTSKNPRVGGILPDLASGYRENYATGFAAPNLMENQLSDGRNKGFAYRLGEGLGTIGRFVDSPLGRGLIAGGLTSALGYNNALQEGLTAAVGRQNAQTADRLYRQSLADNGIDTTDIGGNITDSMYTQMLRAKQLQDNAAYRQMYYDNQQKQNEIMNQLRQDQLEFQKQKSAEDRAFRNAQLSSENNYRNAQIGLGYARLNANNKENKENAKAAENLANLNAIQKQLDRFSNTFDDVNNPYRYRIAGGASQKLNTLTPAESNFNSQASLLLNKIARDLGGEKGVLSDQDIARIKESMPTLGDTKAQKKAKMTAIYNLLDDRIQQYAPIMQQTNNTASDEGWAF